MCLDTNMVIWFLVFLLFVTASPFVVLAAVVHVVRSHRTEAMPRILD